MASIRDLLKRALPDDARSKLRDWARGPGIDTQVLRPAIFAPETGETARLTFILPSLSAKEAFGGVTTGLQYALALGAILKADVGAEIRILTEAAYDPDDSVLDGQARAAGLDPATITVASLSASQNRVSTRAREVFFAYNWWISLNIAPVIEAQATHFGTALLPQLYIIQEYEPAFYPFSSAHVLALHAFNPPWPLWAVFNSSELADYYTAQGNACARSWVFEPRLNAKIGAFRDGITAEEKTRTILVYGRPSIPRNCFSLLKGGLQAWAAAGNTQGWRVVSAGMKHADIDLGHGQRITSLGKLSLEEYGRLLREAAVGVSLMSSPHPSYPPLEMAHFGIRTITNRYPGKDLSAKHDNITSLPDVMPATLGRVLSEACAGFETDPEAGPRGVSHMPDYLSDSQFECLPEMATEVVALLRKAVA